MRAVDHASVGIGKFLGDDELGGGGIDAALGRQQIPIALVGQILCFEEAQFLDRSIYRLARCLCHRVQGETEGRQQNARASA